MIGVAPAVLFVCTANVCRSPMAQALFRALIVREVPGGEQWTVESAGTWGTNGLHPSENSVKVMAARGLDISGHRSRILDAVLLKRFDLILVMEPGHKEALQIEFADMASRVFLLSEMSGPAAAIADPYGSSLERYEQTAQVIEGYLQAGLERIQTLVAAA
jgi:protein-tyrosine-phosphatase